MLGGPRGLSFWLTVAAVGLSAILSISVFPPFQSTEAVWCSLAPLLLALRPEFCRHPARVGFIYGLIVWVATLYWLRHVTVVGWWMLAAYCAVYPMLFCWLVNRAWRRIGDRRGLDRLLVMLAMAVIWTGLEWFRSFVGTGFPWNLLGVAAYQRASLMQLATLGGVYLISFVIVFFNGAIAFTVLRYIRFSKTGRRTAHLELMAAFLLVASAVLFGVHQLRTAEPPARSVRVGLVQPNIPQDQKWTREFVSEIYRRLWNWTQAVQATGPLDLVVWPETSVPDDILDSETSMNLVANLTSNGVPLLVGSMDVAWPEEGSPMYFNSAFLFGDSGRLLDRYDKRHLVLMGEYIPFHRYLGFINSLSPIQVSFTAGAEPGVMTLPDPEIPFAALICFEDTLPYLARDAVRAGARLLVNQTNDAWFDPSAGSRQHLMQAVFRAAENRVPLIRSCNTGVTAFIDRFGRIQQKLEREDGVIQFEGFLTGELAVPADEAPMTIYTRYGDVFAGMMGLLTLGFLMFEGRGALKKRFF